jgi:hypothetical protein
MGEGDGAQTSTEEALQIKGFLWSKRLFTQYEFSPIFCPHWKERVKTRRGFREAI